MKTTVWLIAALVRLLVLPKAEASKEVNKVAKKAPEALRV
jgi:hypothetical protein